MKLTLAALTSVPASASPYRLLDDQGREIAWANAFLDAQRVRQLSLRSLRAYAYDLLHFARWWRDPSRSLSEIGESTVLDYVRHQLDQQPKPTPQTVNHRLGVLDCLYRFHYGREIPTGHAHFQRAIPTRSPLAYGRPRRRVARVSAYGRRAASSCRWPPKRSPGSGAAFGPFATSPWWA